MPHADAGRTGVNMGSPISGNRDPGLSGATGRPVNFFECREIRYPLVYVVASELSKFEYGFH